MSVLDMRSSSQVLSVESDSDEQTVAAETGAGKQSNASTFSAVLATSISMSATVEESMAVIAGVGARPARAMLLCASVLSICISAVSAGVLTRCGTVVAIGTRNDGAGSGSAGSVANSPRRLRVSAAEPADAEGAFESEKGDARTAAGSESVRKPVISQGDSASALLEAREKDKGDHRRTFSGHSGFGQKPGRISLVPYVRTGCRMNFAAHATTTRSLIISTCGFHG